MSLSTYTRKILMFLVPITIGIFWSLPTFADTQIIGQTVADGIYDPLNNIQIGQSFTALISGTLTHVVLPLTKTSGANFNCQMIISIPLGVNNDFGTASVSIDGSDQTNIANWRDFAWSNSPTVIAGQQYWLMTNCSVGNRNRYYGSNADTLNGGLMGTSTTRGSIITANPSLKDLTFVLYASSSVSNNSIVFASTPSTISNFLAWSTNAYVKTASTTEAIANWDRYVRWGNDISMPAISDEDGVGLIDPFTLGVSPPFDIPVGSPFAVGQTYFAQAILCGTRPIFSVNECTGANLINSSPIWSFTVNSSSTIPASGWVSGVTATSTTNSDNFTCDPSAGVFASSLCNLFKTLFVPNPQTLANFSGLQARVANKPPFGYYTIYSNEVKALGSATSTTSTINGLTSTNAMQLNTISGLPVISTILSVFSWFLWVVFVFYIYKRFKYFSLHG